MLAVLTNIPTPYRTAFFNSLNIELIKSGIEFHVIYCSLTETRRFWTFDENENHYNYTILKGIHLSFNNFYPHINPSVVKVLNKLNPKYLILAGAWNTPTMIFALFLYRSKTKKLFWSEGHHAAQRSNNKLIATLRKFVLKKFDGFLVPNEISKEYIQDVLNSINVKIGSLPNTIDEIFFNEELVENKLVLRDKYKISSNFRCIVLISNLTKTKGVLTFLEAYSELSIEFKEKYKILILGTGELFEEIDRLIHKNELKNVRLFGQVDKYVVREILKLADIFALPTMLDSNPLTPIEASFMKKPLMLSKDAGNFNELLLTNTGLPIVEINKDSIKKSLLTLSNLSDLELKEMGNNAYNNVIQNFRRENVSKNLIHFLSQKMN